LTLLIAKLKPEHAEAAKAALATWCGVGDVHLYLEQATDLPAPAEDTLAADIAELIAPHDNQPMRREALESALGGHDSFWDGKGLADPSLRNGFVAVSKALRPLFPHDASPIDRLARRVKHYEPGTRRYLGTRYQITPLGKAVKARLIAMGAIHKGLKLSVEA